MKSQQLPRQWRVRPVVKRKAVIEKKVRDNPELGPQQGGERRAQEPEPYAERLKDDRLCEHSKSAKKCHAQQTRADQAVIRLRNILHKLRYCTAFSFIPPVLVLTALTLFNTEMPRFRTIPTLLVLSVLVFYGAFYGATLFMLHSNGFGIERLIIFGQDGDSYEYVSLAQTMISDGRFAMSQGSVPESFRTPGYPALLAVILLLTNSLAVIPIVQIVLAAFSCGLIYLLGEYFFSSRVGLAAALLFALEPAVVTNAFISASDIPFVFLLLCGAYTMTAHKRGAWTLFSGGMLFGAAALVRPLGLYVIPLVLVWLLWDAYSADRKAFPRWRPVLRASALFLLGAALFVAPWMARNYTLFHQATLSSVGGYNLLFYAQEFEHQRTGKSKEVVAAETNLLLGVGPGDDITTAPFARRDSTVAMHYILAHPFEYAAFHLYSMVPFYLGSSIETLDRALYLRGLRAGTLPPDINISVLLRTGDFSGTARALGSNLPALLERIVWLLLCAAAFGTTVWAVLRRMPDAAVYMLFFALILAFGLMTGPVSYSRYRLPVDPFIFILGCAGIAQAAGYFKHNEKLLSKA